MACTEAVVAYVRGLMHALRPEPHGPNGTAARQSLAEPIFRLLTSRPFCYLSRSRVAMYRDAVLASLREDLQAGRPLRFFYDIGGGYHASRDPWEEGHLSFDAGLGELCILAQIATFHRRVREHYAPGVEFHLVIDNLCALVVNDIPLASTTAYCRRLRSLIQNTGMNSIVSLVVESEHFDPSQYGIAEAPPLSRDVSRSLKPSDVENVARFLGRPCGEAEAVQRMAKYRVGTAVSEEHLGLLIDGVHMTQRASPTTLCFRPFEGADVRIQAGEVALTNGRSRGVRPVLLTSRNRHDYHCHSLRLPGILPQPIEAVTVAVSNIRDALTT